MFKLRGRIAKHFLPCLLFAFILFSILTTNVTAWGNGGYSDDPSNPDYGTHDWMAQHALDRLPSEEKEYIENNLATYLYGTELPDNGGASDGIGDTSKHHIYYFSNGTLQDDSSAVRASEEYDITLGYLKSNDFVNAAKHAGIMTHYIADMAVFSHVMGASTDWGAEQHHSDYEYYVNIRTNGYIDDFNIYLSYDGSLDIATACDAAKNLPYDTTFDINGNLTCVWMDENYNWNDPVFKDRCGESLNLAVNYLTDVLHTLYLSRSNATGMNQVVINELELNPSGNDDYLTVLEWVELYNPTASDVDISGWTLSTTHDTTVTVTIPSGTTIEANGYYVYERGQQWMDNTDESITLKNSIGVEIDRTPIKSDGDNNDYCWARFPNGYDTDSSSDWRFQFATKGASNGRASSSISCILSSTSLEIGSSITISGAITPSRSGVTVDLGYTMPNGTVIKITIITNSSGGYSDTYTLSVPGSWSVIASWEGDQNHEGDTSPIVSFTVTKIPTALSCSVSPQETKKDETIIVSGSINPVIEGVTLTLTYKKPDGSTFTRTATTGSDGSYSDSYTPDAIGTWSVTASWAGDSTYNGASSLSESFTVKSDCLIATATYGSELSPEVQFLRGFRDNIVLRTFAGSQFIIVFNSIYYSFSPAVASVISSSEVIRSLMKALLYPLMGILRVGAMSYSLLSFSPEMGILVFCWVVSSLMSVVYLVPWALLVGFLKKTAVSIKTIRIAGLIWSGSITVTLVAEVTKSPLLIMASGGVFNVATACLTTLATVRTVTKRIICETH